MLTPAEIKSTFPVPASSRASSKQAKAPSSLPPAPSRFPLRPAGAPPSPKRQVFDFDSLYRNYERSIYSKCFRIVRNHTEAEDLVQEVFLQLLRKADTFRGEAKFSTWLHRLTINAALMQLRRLRRSELRTTSLDDSPTSGEEFVAGYKIPLPRHGSGSVAADGVSLRVAVSQLPHGYREVLSLHDVEGYTHAEIAGKLGISVGASKSQLHRARTRIRALLLQGQKSAGCPSRRSLHTRKATLSAPSRSHPASQFSSNLDAA